MPRVHNSKAAESEPRGWARWKVSEQEVPVHSGVWIPESLWVYHAALSANWNGKLENEGRDFEVVPLRGQQNARI
jgi:hypothetical protein